MNICLVKTLHFSSSIAINMNNKNIASVYLYVSQRYKRDYMFGETMCIQSKVLNKLSHSSYFTVPRTVPNIPFNFS